MKSDKIIVHPEESYRKRYNIRKSTKKSSKYHEVTIPYEVIEKQARANGMSVEEFVEKFDVEYLFNSFLGVHLNFIRKDENER